MIGLSKSDQLRKNGTIKQKPFVDKKYLAYLHSQPQKCFVCGGSNKIELHHVKLTSSDLKDDRLVIPLCGEEHHRNGELTPHGNPKRWRETYPIEVQREYAQKLYNEYKSNSF